MKVFSVNKIETRLSFSDGPEWQKGLSICTFLFEVTNYFRLRLNLKDRRSLS